jgi:26S proteasome regulatory subunit N3
MVDKRALRSNKPTASSSTNGEKATSSSSSSQNSVTNSQGKSGLAKTPSTRTRAATGKLGNSAATDMGDDKPHINGTEPVENGVSTNGTSDVEMKDDSSEPPRKAKQGKDKDGDEEMTVVVPPSKGSKLSGEAAKDREGDVTMEGSGEAKDETPAEVKEDPVAKAVSGESAP